jgi:hypothetical protein
MQLVMNLECGCLIRKVQPLVQLVLYPACKRNNSRNEHQCAGNIRVGTDNSQLSRFTQQV